MFNLVIYRMIKLRIYCILGICSKIVTLIVTSANALHVFLEMRIVNCMTPCSKYVVVNLDCCVLLVDSPRLHEANVRRLEANAWLPNVIQRIMRQVC